MFLFNFNLAREKNPLIEQAEHEKKLINLFFFIFFLLPNPKKKFFQNFTFVVSGEKKVVSNKTQKKFNLIKLNEQF